MGSFESDLFTKLGRICSGLLIPLALAMSPSQADAQESPYLYGIHDHDTGIQEYLDHLSAGGVTGWVTATIAIGSNPFDTGGDDFRSISDQGSSVIVRLNNGYCGAGTIPTPDKYDDFAQRAANYVAATQGADIFIVGNETNLPAEWPPQNGHASYVSPQSYAVAFRKVYDAIKAVRPDAKVLPQALAPFAGPYSSGSTCGFTHDANPLNWVQYMYQMLSAIKATGGIDGVALHINSRGYTFDDIHSTQKVNAGGQDLYFSFYVYKDWIDYGIPSDLYNLPLYATEANGIYYWSGGHPERPDSHYESGWVQEIYAEINRYNSQAAVEGKPVFRAVNMYRWCRWCDGWNIDGSPYKEQILADLDQAVSMRYRWPETGEVLPPAPPPAGENVARNAAAWLASSAFNSQSGGDRAYDGVVAESSKWTSDGVGSQSWLALDLGARYDISGFVVRHAGAGGEAAHFNTIAYRLESGATLSGPWVTLATVSNASQSDVVTTSLSEQATTRFVRLLVTDAGIDNYARIPEFEVYAAASAPPPDPAPEPPPGENVARNALNWSASSTFDAASGGNRAYDGAVAETSKWTSDGVSAESWLALDLGATYDVGGFVVQHAGAAGEPSYFNTAAFRLEIGDSIGGPWTSVATVDNSANDDSSTIVLADAAIARYVRLYVSDPGIDNYARIPEFEVYGTARPETQNLIANGRFDQGTSAWSRWTERGGFDAVVSDARLQLISANHNGGLYQQFSTGGAGTEISIEGFWASEPSAPQTQWAEILVINGPRLPVAGTDIGGDDSDVVLIYKNDTWVSPQGWSGSMAETSPVASAGVFTATGEVATIVLKSGNLGSGSVTTGTRFDDITVTARGSTPGGNLPPAAVISATATVGQAPLSVGFDAAGSTDPDGDALSYAWDLGDGAVASGPAASHVYASNGTYVVTLTVDDGRGASGEASTVITVGSATVEMPDFCPPALNFQTIRDQLGQQGQALVSTKIGFHVGPAGNQQGLGDWMQCLDAAGIPFFLKSADSAGQIFEAVKLKAASGVPHVLVYRKASVTSSDAEQNWDPGVPEYDLPPLEAAENHWRRQRDAFPPELEEYKRLIWIETVNEIDKNRSEWLAEFSYYTALMAMRDGFNWAAFSWSSGEPERANWEGPEMQRFLALAGQYPDRIAVALHEYSYVTDSLNRDFPFLVGRFQMLFDVADSLGIPRPTVLVTEFGWAYQDVAPIGQAMQIDLPWADWVYSQYPQVKGAAIWYLGPGFGGIANQAQQLIAPLTEYSLQNYFVIPSQ